MSEKVFHFNFIYKIMKNVKKVSWGLLYVSLSISICSIFVGLFNMEDVLVRFFTWFFFASFVVMWILLGIEMYKDLNDK